MALKTKPLAVVRRDIPTNEAAKPANIVRVGLNVSEKTRQRWKIAALTRGITLAELIESSVDAAIQGTNEHLSK